MNQKKAFIFKFLISFLILLAAVLWIRKDMYVSSGETRSCDILSIDGISSYDYCTEEDGSLLFWITGTDPHFTISLDGSQVGGVTVYFSRPLESSMAGRIYYKKAGEEFSQDRSVYLRLLEGETSVSVSFPYGCYEQLRIDIDEEFYLSGMETVLYDRLNTGRILAGLSAGLLLLFLLWWKGESAARAFSAGLSAVILFGEKHRIRTEHVFLILGLVAGLSFLLVVPPYEVPDELVHCRMIFNEIGASGYAEEVEDYYDAAGSSVVKENTALRQDTELLKGANTLRFSDACVWTGKISPLVIRHLPAALGMMLGLLTGAPIGICLLLAEAGSLLFYLLAGYLTLKTAPVMKEVFLLILLLPMTLQQCTSVNYDAVVLPLSFLFFSFLLDLICGERRLYWKEMFLASLILLVIVLIKPPYVLFAVLFLLVPREKWELKIGKWDMAGFFFRHAFLFWALVFAAGAAGLILLRNNEYVLILRTAVRYPKHYAKILLQTFEQNTVFYIESLFGQFGWLDTLMPVPYYWFAAGAALFAALTSGKGTEKEEGLLSAKKDGREGKPLFFAGGKGIFPRLFMLLLSAALILLIITALIDWSYHLAGYSPITSFAQAAEAFLATQVSTGVQGRYFIPVLLIALFSVRGLVSLPKKTVFLAQCLYYPVILGWTLTILVQRFWI